MIIYDIINVLAIYEYTINEKYINVKSKSAIGIYFNIIFY